MIYTDPSGHKWYHKLIGFASGVANDVTFGGYDYVMDKLGATSTNADYYLGRMYADALLTVVSAYGVAAAITGQAGGGATCLFSAGGGCVIAALSTGVLVAAGFEGTFASMMANKDSELYQYYKSEETSQSLSNIAGKYGNCKCVEAAKDMKSYLIKNGLKGEQISIKYDSQGFIVSDSYGSEAISRNGYHTGILYEGKVYDNIHPNGISYQDWLNDLHGVGNRTITRTSIN